MTLKAIAVLLLVFAMTTMSSASGRLLLVANQVDHTLVLVDPDAGQRVGVVTVGVNGHEVTASGDGKLAYVPIYGDSALGLPGTDGHTIDVVDIGGRRVAYSIDLGKAVRPHKAQLGGDGLLYVTGELANEVVIVDPKARKVVGTISTDAPETHMIVMHGDHLYTSNVAPGSVSVLDVKARKNLGVIKASESPTQRITVSPDGNWVFTHARNGDLVVIDTRTKKVKTTIRMPGRPFSSVATNDGKALIVLLGDARKAVVVDVPSFKIAKAIDLNGSPMEALVDPSGDLAYISLFDSGQIAVLDLKSWMVKKEIKLSRGVDGLAFVGE